MVIKANQDWQLTPQTIPLNSPEEMEPLEDDAVKALANYSKNADDYATLLEALGLEQALERLRGYGAAKHTLRCV